MSRYAYRVAYDGRPFYGFQRQPDVPTVEGALFDALRELDLHDGVPEGYAAAGRTDAGVSARAQTITLRAPDWCTPAALNSALPPTVWAWARTEVDDDFHATHDATARSYVYHIYAPRSHTDDDAIDRAGERLAGRHDFHNLTPDEQGTKRDLDLTVERDGTFTTVQVTADGFPRQLVRRLVALLDAIGRGPATLDTVDRLLGDAPVDGPDGVGPAPPEPLVLTDVRYPSCAFEPEQEAVASARTALAERRVAALRAGRVLGTVVDGFGGE